jgi:hypothetical protein
MSPAATPRSDHARRPSSPAPEPSLNHAIRPDGLPWPQRRWATLASAVAVTMAVLDSAVANIAPPAIARQLGMAPAESVWVVNACQLAIVVPSLPLASLGAHRPSARVHRRAGPVQARLAGVRTVGIARDTDRRVP